MDDFNEKDINNDNNNNQAMNNNNDINYDSNKNGDNDNDNNNTQISAYPDTQISGFTDTRIKHEDDEESLIAAMIIEKRKKMMQDMNKSPVRPPPRLRYSSSALKFSFSEVVPEVVEIVPEIAKIVSDISDDIDQNINVDNSDIKSNDTLGHPDVGKPNRLVLSSFETINNLFNSSKDNRDLTPTPISPTPIIDIIDNNDNEDINNDNNVKIGPEITKIVSDNSVEIDQNGNSDNSDNKSNDAVVQPNAGRPNRLVLSSFETIKNLFNSSKDNRDLTPTPTSPIPIIDISDNNDNDDIINNNCDNDDINKNNNDDDNNKNDNDDNNKNDDHNNDNNDNDMVGHPFAGRPNRLVLSSFETIKNLFNSSKDNRDLTLTPTSPTPIIDIINNNDNEDIIDNNSDNDDINNNNNDNIDNHKNDSDNDDINKNNNDDDNNNKNDNDKNDNHNHNNDNNDNLMVGHPNAGKPNRLVLTSFETIKNLFNSSKDNRDLTPTPTSPTPIIDIIDNNDNEDIINNNSDNDDINNNNNDNIDNHKNDNDNHNNDKNDNNSNDNVNDDNSDKKGGSLYPLTHYPSTSSSTMSLCSDPTSTYVCTDNDFATEGKKAISTPPLFTSIASIFSAVQSTSAGDSDTYVSTSDSIISTTSSNEPLPLNNTYVSTSESKTDVSTLESKTDISTSGSKTDVSTSGGVTVSPLPYNKPIINELISNTIVEIKEREVEVEDKKVEVHKKEAKIGNNEVENLKYDGEVHKNEMERGNKEAKIKNLRVHTTEVILSPPDIPMPYSPSILLLHPPLPPFGLIKNEKNLISGIILDNPIKDDKPDIRISGFTDKDMAVNLMKDDKLENPVGQVSEINHQNNYEKSREINHEKNHGRTRESDGNDRKNSNKHEKMSINNSKIVNIEHDDVYYDNIATQMKVYMNIYANKLICANIHIYKYIIFQHISILF
jgi:hypothetical protein